MVEHPSLGGDFRRDASGQASVLAGAGVEDGGADGLGGADSVSEKLVEQRMRRCRWEIERP